MQRIEFHTNIRTMPDTDRVQIGSLTVGYIAAGLFWGAFAVSAPDFQAASGLDTAGFGMLLFAMAAGALPAMLLLGRQMHRVQRWAMPACLALFAISGAFLGLADGVVWLTIGFLLVGAASGALDIALNMRVSILEGATGKRLFNRAHATFPLALLIASPLTGVARDAGVGPHVIFPCLGVLLLSAALLEFLAGKAPAPHSGPAPPAPIRMNAVLVCLGSLAALGAFTEMSAYNWSAIFVETALNASATTAGLAAGGFTLGLSLGRFGAHGLETRMTDAGVIRLAATLGIPAFLLIALVGSPVAALTGFLIAGMAVGPIEPTVFRIVSGRYGPKERGRALSAVTAVTYLGYLISPPILGAVAQQAGWTIMWTLAAAIAGVVIGLTLLLAQLQRSDIATVDLNS